MLYNIHVISPTSPPRRIAFSIDHQRAVCALLEFTDAARRLRWAPSLGGDLREDRSCLHAPQSTVPAFNARVLRMTLQRSAQMSLKPCRQPLNLITLIGWTADGVRLAPIPDERCFVAGSYQGGKHVFGVGE